MPSIRISPVQDSSFETMMDVQPINDSDADCLIAIRAVLEMHGKLDRFGVALLPSDVPMDERDIVLGRSEGNTPELELKQEIRLSAPEQTANTVWKLNEAGTEMLSWWQTFQRRRRLRHLDWHPGDD